jgi:hypothetical protein
MTPQDRVNPSSEVIIHELGHLLVGCELGLTEGGIEFTENNPYQVAKAHYTQYCTISQIVVRSIAGMYAQATCVPDSVEDDLRERILTCTLFDDASVLSYDSTMADTMVRHGFIEDWQILIAQAKASTDLETEQLLLLRTAHEQLIELFSSRDLQHSLSVLKDDVAEWLRTEDDELADSPRVFYRRDRADRALTKVGIDVVQPRVVRRLRTPNAA